MIRLYTAPSPNSTKVRIALHELGLRYETVPIDVKADAQHAPWFEKICPNNKIPALDDDGTIVWESGAILLYLAERHDPEHRILGASERDRWEAVQYTFFQAAGLGPNLGRLSTQLQKPAAERNTEMVEIFTDEVDRLLGVLDRILADGRSFLARDYSIADIMHYPWLRPVWALGAPQLTSRPRLVEWLQSIEGRPAVQRALSDA